MFLEIEMWVESYGCDQIAYEWSFRLECGRVLQEDLLMSLKERKWENDTEGK